MANRTDKGSSKETIAKIQKWVSRLQSNHNLWSYNVTVFETRGGLHAHILFIGNAAITDRLNRSAFGPTVFAEPVTDPDGLSKQYLAKERTPQAGYKRTDLGGRIGGSHRLPGGGDRVRLSRDLSAMPSRLVWSSRGYTQTRSAKTSANPLG